MLLLFSQQKTSAELGFERVSQFYGLKVAAIDLASTTLTDARLRDEAGAYYSLVYGDGLRLDGALTTAERLLLQAAIASGSLNFLVTNLRQANSLTVQTLTAGEITGSALVTDLLKDYHVARSYPALTRELSGLTITHESDPQDEALSVAANAPHTAVIVDATNAAGEPYAVFARYQAGGGAVYVASNFTDSRLATGLLRDNYNVSSELTDFRQRWFAQLMPLMMVVRHTAGDEAWHSDRDYANFTLDDPPLQPSDFDYAGILAEALAHNFHFTLALPPGRSTDRDLDVVALFKDHPQELSLVQHGNNHDGYEFYHYSDGPGLAYPPRPYVDQMADVVEGRARLDSLTQQTGLRYALAMVFPYNISPAQTLVFLKSQNYLATVNSANIPLDRPQANAWDAEMYPAEMSYASFAVIKRYHAQAAPYPFDLFIDRPAWLYEHKEIFAADGIGWLSPIAEAVNALEGGVEWRSLDYILTHLYHEKRNDDGSVGVRFWTNVVTVANTSGAGRTFHFQREEAENVAILAVTVDGQPVAYTVSGGWLRVTTQIPAGAERTIRITYGP